MFEDYELLPDYMDADTLENTFRDFLRLVHSSHNVDLVDAANGLLQLADRQWHTYELLDGKLRRQIDEWVLSIWDVSNVKLVDVVTCIVGQLGLRETYVKIKESLVQELSPEARNEIVQCIKENDNGRIDNPYIEMGNTDTE